MKKIKTYLIISVVALFAVSPVFAEDDNIAKKMNDILLKAVEEGHWQVNADELYMWLKTKKTDFLVVDVRPGADAYREGHIPGAIHIPYNAILTPESLKSLPKDKKIVLVCATGQLENLPVVPLRMLGYDANTLAFGYAAWVKGSRSGEQMKAVINKAGTKNYPVEK
ncbi:MAG: rhodanese-like domain-containing protein [Nitrospirae bacterium]|nr:rhodanese-like domain-containing protein [Nitrospirota bacterium]MCL5237486.1 rhodanese-like domain-containing protein [Nitrospirota bacterium]